MLTDLGNLATIPRRQILQTGIGSSTNGSKCQKLGPNCTYVCHCAGGLQACRQGGICIGHCANGWIGRTCQIPCPLRTYGANCSHNCSVNCRNETCNHEDGFCFCKSDAPTHGCQRHFTDYESAFNQFWLIGCALSLIAVSGLIFLGPRCNAAAKSRKNQFKFLQYVFNRRNSGSSGDSAARRNLGLYTCTHLVAAIP
ncbi:multiple epidermal growth factor-like domains protein 10 [Plakobranchus ocellatus]|uniref:Multiple epidermal growth factor-like domains protein 10 n=1 Tax=Plakobranchus ocellatus TaxID=259542 RepID=A0AAV4AS60_9GAST|nr:multiple epidermal growth factor-like domains protein 10 [Plakobranchus ocellatus]